MLEIYHSNKLEVLASLLCEARKSNPLSDPLTAETILVPNAGIRRWLNFQLAKHDGIAANIDYVYPATYTWRLYKDCFDNVPQQSSFDQGPLRLHVHSQLEIVSRFTEVEWAPLQRYICLPDDTVDDAKSMQLASRIADVFNQYLLYRPEMLLAWENGSDELPGEDPMQLWQPALWRRLVNTINEPHRAQLWERFCAGPAQLSISRSPAHLHLFNVGLLPPSTLDVLMSVARFSDIQERSHDGAAFDSSNKSVSKRVSFYLQNPVTVFGDGIIGSQEQQLNKVKLIDQPSDVLQEHVNPLLKSLGGSSQMLFKLLHERFDGIEVHTHKSITPKPASGLLENVQHDLLHSHENSAAAVKLSKNEDDTSIQFHQCYSPLREVQALHDYLLDRFNADPSLVTSDVLVMMPDINKYAPIVEAVFGSAGDGVDRSERVRYIPWSVADRSLVEASRVVDCVQRLFKLPGFEFEASGVLAFAAEPAVARRFGFDHESLKTLNQWLRDTGIRRTLAGSAEQCLESDKPTEHSFDFGLRRLLLGRAMPAGSGAIGDTLPWTEVDGQQAALLSELIRLVDLLNETQKKLREPRPVSGWVEALNDIVENFLLPDDDEADALMQMREELAKLADNAMSSHSDTSISHASFAELLSATLAGAQRRSYRYLTGRVTFSSMLPLRPVPFRHVCLLGMNDADFPRRRDTLGFDLVGLFTREGDRSGRDDDRSLFLDTLLSAGDELYLSWIYRNPADNARREPSVLITELRDYLRARFPGVKARCIEHPLQPFSTRLYSTAQSGEFTDNPLQSFASEWAPPTDTPQTVALTTLGGLESERSLTADTAALTTEKIGVADLQRFWRNPSDWYCRNVLGIALWRDEEEPGDAEPFELDPLEAYHVRESLLQALLTQKEQFVDADQEEVSSEAINADIEKNAAYNRLRQSGSLPHAVSGELEFEALFAQVRVQKDVISNLFQLPLAHSHVEIDVAVSGQRVQGRLHNVVKWPDAEGIGLLHYSTSALKGRHLMALRLDQLIGSAAGLLDGPCVVVTKDAKISNLAPVSAKSALQQLTVWLDGWHHGQRHALPFFPNTSAALAELIEAEERGNDKDILKAKNKVKASWLTSFSGVPGESDHEAVSLLYPDAAEVLERDDVKAWAECIYKFMTEEGEINE